MKQLTLKQSNQSVPALIAGFWRAADVPIGALAKHIDFCVENGITFFDHADVYGRGICESKFGEALKATTVNREDLWIQSKCGIVPGSMYDFSEAHLLEAVDGILSRLRVDYLDSLLLHRPDALMEPEDVASAFDKMYKSGKVRHFGVSNHTPMQIELLKTCVEQPLEFNQLQLSIPYAGMITNGMEMNMTTPGAADHDGYVLDYSRIHGMTLQAWSPFQKSFMGGAFIGDRENFASLNDVVEELAAKYNVTPAAIAIAWIMRHPAKIQVITGTYNQSHVKDAIMGSEITLTREEWYRLYIAAGHQLP